MLIMHRMDHLLSLVPKIEAQSGGAGIHFSGVQAGPPPEVSPG
jgi:hypothetical protein